MAISLVYQATRTRVAGEPDVSSGASFLIQPSTSSPGCSATAACECEMLIDVAFGSVFLATLAVPAWEPTRGELSSLQPRPGVRVCLRVLCANVWRIQLQLRQQQRGRYSHSLIQTPLRGLGINSREAKLRLSFLQEACVHSIPCWVSRAQGTGAAAVLLGLCPSGRRPGGVDVFVGCIRRTAQRPVDVTSEKADGDRRFGVTSWTSVDCVLSATTV